MTKGRYLAVISATWPTANSLYRVPRAAQVARTVENCETGFRAKSKSTVCGSNMVSLGIAGLWRRDGGRHPRISLLQAGAGILQCQLTGYTIQSQKYFTFISAESYLHLLLEVMNWFRKVRSKSFLPKESLPYLDLIHLFGAWMVRLCHIVTAVRGFYDIPAPVIRRGAPLNENAVAPFIGNMPFALSG
jgi:hypothetical protein